MRTLFFTLWMSLMVGCLEPDAKEIEVGVTTHKHNGELVIQTITDDYAKLQEICDEDKLVNGCWYYYPSIRTHNVYSIPVQCVIDHEWKHVREGQWHRKGHIDECSRTNARWWVVNNGE